MELIGHCKRKRNEEAVSDRQLVEEKVMSISSSSLLQDDDDILIEILKRVHSWKSTHRCKAVCKQWHSIISSRYFIARYKAYHRGLYSPKAHLKSFVVLQLRECNNPTAPKCPVFSLSSNPSGGIRYLKKMVLDFLPTPNFSIEATCQDLMLCRCCSSSSGAYFIVNPLVTRQCLLIPPPPNFIHNHPEIDIFFRTGLMCLDGNNNNSSRYCLIFKVIRIPTFLSSFTLEDASPVPPEWDLSRFRVQIFCSQSYKWTEFIVDWYPFKFNHYLSDTPIISHGGMFRWLNGHSLVSLNPIVGDADNDNQLKLSHTINLPVTLGIDSGTVLLGFGLCNGRLRVITKSQDMIGEAQRALRVWELDDRVGSWKLVHRVLHSYLRRFAAIHRILAFHPYDGNLIFLYLDNEVFRLNLGTRRSNRYKIRKAHRRGCMLENVIQPLLLQWFPTPLSSSLSDSSSIAPCHGQFGRV